MNRSPTSPHSAPEAAWSGLSNLSHGLRKRLAEQLHVIATDGLDWVMAEAHSCCPGDPAHSGRDSVPARQRLGEVTPAILESFAATLRADCLERVYPPEYRFWDFAHPDGDAGWLKLDHYSADRALLRNKLNTRIDDHPEFSSVLVGAAVRDQRFENPHWAPWAPLHWFERLFEACEAHLSASALSLWVMTCYVNHLSTRMDYRLEQTVRMLAQLQLLADGEAA